MVVLLVWALAATVCSSTDDAGGAGTIVYAAAEEPAGFNYNKAENETFTARDLAENLYFYASKADPGYRITFPGLAGQPTLVSKEPQVVEWRIRDEAVWSDGTAVTSEDLRYFREQLIDKDNLGSEHDGYDLMSDVAAVDDKTIRVTFSPKPYTDYEMLWNAVPQAAHLKAQPGGFNTGLDESPGPSAGPFQFKEWKKGESLTLVRNPRWWGQPQPALRSIVFRFIPESGAQINALANGEVDMIAPEPDVDVVRQLADVAATGAAAYTLAFGPSWDLFTFNLRNPILADVRVRRAIAHAVDRDRIVDTVLKPITTDGKRLDNSVYMNNHPAYEAHGAQYARPDPDAARRLLDEAGWVIGQGGVREKDGNRLSMRITAPAGLARYEETADSAIAQLREVGIELRSDDCDLGCLAERAYQGDFDVLASGWGGNMAAVSLIKNIFSTGGEQNFGKFSSPAFDALIEQALTVPDASQQAAIANRADEALWDELPALPLYQAPTLLAVSSRFVGIADNPNGDGVFWNSHTWTERG